MKSLYIAQMRMYRDFLALRSSLLPDNQVHILAEIHGFDFEQLLCLGRGQKSTGDQLVKEGSESQTERYAQNGIRDT